MKIAYDDADDALYMTTLQQNIADIAIKSIKVNPVSTLTSI